MLCQNCQKRLAKVHFTQIINDQKTEVFLCEQCAREKSQFNIQTPMDLSSFFSGILGSHLFCTQKPNMSAQVACDKCGMAFDEFIKVGKLGCENCYETFSERLVPVIKRIHGNVKHTGKVPSRVSESVKASRQVEKLKAELNKAIQAEEYEKAAQIRDKIREFEVKKDV